MKECGMECRRRTSRSS